MPRSLTSKSSTCVPPHWPKHIRYLTAQQYHSSVKKDILEIIRGQQPPSSHQPLQRSFVVIRRITEPSDHPASVFHVCKNQEVSNSTSGIYTSSRLRDSSGYLRRKRSHHEHICWITSAKFIVTTGHRLITICHCIALPMVWSALGSTLL